MSGRKDKYIVNDDNFVLTAFLPFRMNRLAAEVSGRLSVIYAERFGIDIPEWRVMATLGAVEPTTAQAVVASTRTHKSTISRAVSRLIALGWIEQVPSTEDKRERMLRFTPLGRGKFAELVPLVKAFEARLLASMSDAGREGLLSGLAELEGILDLPGNGAV